MSWAGLGSILARLNSTSDEYSNWGRDQGEAREGPGEASLSLTTGQGLSGPQFEVRPMKFVEYSAFAS